MLLQVHHPSAVPAPCRVRPDAPGGPVPGLPHGFLVLAPRLKVQFIGWPDHGVPRSCAPVLELLRIVNDYKVVV